MLAAAGVAFTVEAADVDEPAIRDDAARGKARASTPQQIAEVLARAKAEDVSGKRHPGSLVIGADQVLALGDELLTKATDVDGRARDACASSRAARTSCIRPSRLPRTARCMWAHVGTARLTMRDFSDAFLDDYLTRAGDRVGQSVGAYELEGLGVQLFDSIEGDYFTILGLPLLPLLAELRARGMIAA